MKNKTHYFFVLLALLMSACSGDLMNPIPLIGINPGFSKSGFTNASIISQNDSDVYQMIYNRVYGISRELTMSLVIDEAALAKYNQENNTAYKLLPAQYYTMPSSVHFGVKSKNADFNVIFNSKAIYEFAGSVEAASDYVVPIKAVTDQKTGVDIDESKNLVLLHVNMLPSTISTVIPSAAIDLFFAKGSDSKEQVTLEGAMNFSGIDETAISAVVDKEAPLLVNSTDYTLLPDANYSFGGASLNESGHVVIKGEINGTGLSEGVRYLLPCRLKSSDPDYVIDQTEPVYYTVTVADLKVTVTNASTTKAVAAYTSLSTLTGSVGVTSNVIIGKDLTINFKYDPSLIAGFNSRNGTDYLTLPQGSVEMTNSKIAKGQKEGAVSYRINTSSLTLADKKHYLVPLVLQKSDLELGSVSGSDVIYLDVTKTLAGEYNLQVIVNQRTRNIKNTIWEASACQRAGEAGWDAAIAKAQYGFGGDDDWYAVLFSVTNEDMPGKANCKKIEIFTFLELLTETGGTNKVTENNSYFNTVTGEVYIDCNLFESWFNATYKETYSFTRK
ncbi:MAG: DUF1735 domain-containing protein [Bacteroidota bacterium]|nr:DUF1735 domain-containing protein [Bacteroidota bacterium]